MPQICPKESWFQWWFFPGKSFLELPNFSGNHIHFMDFIYLLGIFLFPPGWAKVRLPVADHTCSFQFSKESLQVANSNDKAEGSYKGMGPRLVIVTSSGAISNPYKWPKIYGFQRVFFVIPFFWLSCFTLLLTRDVACRDLEMSDAFCWGTTGDGKPQWAFLCLCCGLKRAKIHHGNRSFDWKAKGHILMDEVGNYPQKD